MNRKVIGIGLCIIFCLLLNAGRRLDFVDGFRDVEIVDISRQGIRIIHSSGTCTITKSKLSNDGCLLLQKELDQVEQLQRQYDDQQKSIADDHTLQVEQAIKNAESDDNLDRAYKTLIVAESKFPRATNRDLLKKEIEIKKNAVTATHSNRLSDAMTLYKQKKYGEAFEIYRTLAEQDNAEAQFYTGLLYDSGYNGRANYELAFQWYQKSADQGYAEAQDNLGDMYYNGLLGKNNIKEAIKWYQSAADQGLDESKIKLSKIYETGRGGPKDIKKAIELCSEVAEHGDSDAQIQVGELYKLSGDSTQAMAWFRKAAEQGNALAQYILGQEYESGTGGIKSCVEAAKWYRKAADQKFKGAFEKWIECNELTLQTEGNIKKWYISASNSEDPELKAVAIKKLKAMTLDNELKSLRVWTLGSSQARGIAEMIIGLYSAGTPVEQIIARPAIREYAEDNYLILEVILKLKSLETRNNIRQWNENSTQTQESKQKINTSEKLKTIELKSLRVWTLGSSQERNVAEMIIGLYSAGMSVDQIMARPGIREYARDNYLISELFLKLRSFEVSQK